MTTEAWATQRMVMAMMMMIPLVGSCADEDQTSSRGDPDAHDEQNDNAIEPNDAATGTDGEDPLGQAAADPGRPKPETSEQLVFTERELTTDPLATFTGWTPYTSEETPPISCEGSSLAGQFGCSGDYCDNVRLYCTPTPHLGESSYWTDYFSEERDNGNYRYCSPSHWLIGVACTGSYCDNLSLQCRYFPTATAGDCFWTGWVSEEGGGTLQLPAGYYLRGMQCSGDYCDNKRFYACKA